MAWVFVCRFDPSKPSSGQYCLGGSAPSLTRTVAPSPPLPAPSWRLEYASPVRHLQISHYPQFRFLIFYTAAYVCEDEAREHFRFYMELKIAEANRQKKEALEYHSTQPKAMNR